MPDKTGGNKINIKVIFHRSLIYYVFRGFKFNEYELNGENYRDNNHGYSLFE